ncbi:MAG: proline--tRNA ligase [Acidobacteria bacterium]|nr:proline--tRNA ligase [Acidobacteriota bacterium]MCB9398837.1 proline--tRNA ligase [Acidobacteriota bacterium]
MRRSRYLLNTVKETPKEAVVISHQLMLRAGMIKQLASGIYSFLPLALRSLRKIEQIVREEMNAAGAIELLMPSVQPSELWVESGRWQIYGKELLRMKDRKDNDFCYGPTHEEVVTDIVRKEVRSYKDLPLNLYQIQTKFRDEVRPRFGLMRGREFIMKDAYSFDVDDPSADRSYQAMYDAYKRIFSRCGLAFRPVEADSGLIGGSYTHEFHVLAQSGEDEILSCDQCDYAANVERCERQIETRSAAARPFEKVATPGKKSIEDVSAFLNVPAENCLKTLLYQNGETILACCLAGDRELNETALKNLFDGEEVFLVDPQTAQEKYGLPIGFVGPIDLPQSITALVDREIAEGGPWVCGANQVDHHFVGVTADQIRGKIVNLGQTRAGDRCPRCQNGHFTSHRGIEVGHVFKLGTKYSERMGATFLDAQGSSQPCIMGCYGIGVSRTMAAAIEQNFDEQGIIWPLQIAPFHVNLLNLDPSAELTQQTCDSLVTALEAKGIEVLYDDRDERPGFKFKDADLIGLPLQIIVGMRGLQGGTVEIKARRTGQRQQVALAGAVDEVIAQLQELGWGKERV